ncbi:alpha-amylase family glycosyl hydrolase [Mangrovimonas spongiae]|uniref:T9SS C-terminal target domain-containing protein n=1 Tax=Mangrovimonas spongiae TaxID=2494697 RepID=A0A428K6B5_9FLAO|nr:alpha-amylase family glycosyl hydrolase [Mangrovimonas spongiae]RSK41901.1 T9SS C-terminal target domain-containing protein [Mangrovimonas spongiae]
MKKKLLILILFAYAVSYSQVTIAPSPFQVDESINITVDLNSSDTDCNGINNPTKVYMHAGIGDDSDPWGFNVIGNWGEDDGIGEMTDNQDGTWSISITPETYFSLSTSEASQATKMGLVFRNEDGTEEMKASGCTDFFFNVGTFQVTMINPSNSSNGIIVVDNGGGTQILAQNSGGPANYELFANGVSVHTQNNTTFYNGYLFSGLTENQYCELVITQNGSTITKVFTIFVNNSNTEDMPADLENGINYDEVDNSKATLVLDAPNKDFVYIAGSFNNWEPTASHAMKKDSSTGKFWVELTGLTPETNYTYQYWVGAISPVSGSPKLVKTADPFSTLVLSPYDDPWIPETTYPNIPSYPTGQEREVTVLKTGQIPYNWQVTNFQKPKKEDLIIYEVLIRDFDSDRNFQDLIDKIDYFKNLNINAIELMPVMEFEGNESWGYNTSFHMALDKFYGTKDKLKEFIDVCHQNDIAVILDVALNHAFGRNPMVRMWMDDPDGDGWGGPSSENPYFNQTPRHSYNVGNDFNHQESRTQYYVQRVVKHWIEEFNIDGFRWDLTKGFTQNCSESDENCTNSYQQDRVDVLKSYADYSWSLDPDHYVIFEHLGGTSEEQQWANYRINEGKGIMMWKEIWNDYKNLAQGNSGNINAMGNVANGFTEKRALGYPESHDKDRIMYEMLQFGNSSGGYDVTNLNTALERMSSIGAISLTIPGPKMIWHFADLGMDVSIWTCDNGSVNTDYDGNNDGDCKLSTKPQPQWTNNWLSDANRSQIYNDWARLNYLKINEAVFEGDYAINSGNTTPRIYIWDDNIPANELKNVVILANFGVTTQNIVPDFPYTGTWYDLMDETGNTSINVTSTTATISIPAGQFRIYGNATSTLSIDDVRQQPLSIYPNPANDAFYINTEVNNVKIIDLNGKIVQEFNGNFSKNHAFNISNLAKSLYIVKAQNNSGAIKTTKLVKF